MMRERAWSFTLKDPCLLGRIHMFKKILRLDYVCYYPRIYAAKTGEPLVCSSQIAAACELASLVF